MPIEKEDALWTLGCVTSFPFPPVCVVVTWGFSKIGSISTEKQK